MVTSAEQNTDAYKSGYFLTFMPVPDQVRDDGSGIQKHNNLKNTGFRVKSGMTN
jgi:hypothetical protein